MRRGHPGRGGWRNDGPRQFMPRTGLAPGFRPTRGFPPPLANNPRFRPPGIHRFPQFGTPQTYSNSPIPQGGLEHGPSDYNDQNRYPMLNRQLNARNSAPNQNASFGHLPALDRHSQFQKQPEYFEQGDQDERYHTNSMGDVDQRTFRPQHRQETFAPPQFTPSWATRNRPRSYSRNQDIPPPEANKLPSQDHSSHRPPSSDHYEARPAIAVDNTETFSRTFDDTVDIVRRRMLNRNDPENQTSNENHEESESMQQPPTEANQPQNTPRVPFQRRKLRPKQSMNNNCDKIKTKIVHQLFKMDKERMHKLMDNPNSSTKFEYAINSLITESQNSYNRHVRAAAEKSLGGVGPSRNDIIQYNENDTIYEDTFMRQMQCILEPQDTIILEDIKPIVMAELNKVLQLNEYELTHDLTYDDSNYHNTRDQQNYNQDQHYDEYPEYKGECQDNQQYYANNLEHDSFSNPDSQSCESVVMQKVNDDTSGLFERRSSSKSSENRRKSRLESRQSRSVSKDATDNLSIRVANRPTTPNRSATPLFDSNAEQFSEDEDPFADLDKQYHVAVDHSFIADEDPTLPKPPKTFPVSYPSPKVDLGDRSHNHRNSYSKKESSRRDHRSKSTIQVDADPSRSIEALEAHRKAILDDLENEAGIKAELLLESTQNISSTEVTIELAKDANTVYTEDDKKEKISNSKIQDGSHKLDSSPSLEKSLTSVSRKRSVDQQPSHRKEKRKKSDTTPIETNKQILNKNIIINVNDCLKTEKCETSKTNSVFNLFFSKGDRGTDTYKDSKKNEGTDSGYSDKYVKRKESSLKPVKDKSSDDKKKRISSSNHSSSSSKDNSLHTNSSKQTPAKEKDKEDVKSKLRSIQIFPVKDEFNSKVKVEPSDKDDAKAKLTSIDIFSDKPKKTSSSHQAVRNTAVISIKTEPVTPEKVKTVPAKISKQIVRKHTISTQVILKCPSKCTQTINKLVTNAVQTDPVTFGKSPSKAKDSFERMKEIDLEIQSLVQEKFALYNSLESKDAPQTVGMTVLKVSEDTKSEDEIIDEFTSIPEEELEALALESMEAINAETPKSKKTNQRQKVQEQRATTPKLTKKNKKVKTVLKVSEDTKSEDEIINELTSIPEEELEALALESMEAINAETPKSKKKNQRQKDQEQRANTPKSTKKNKKVKTPNISLLEQIIEDDRPIEDIISLDELESSPRKTRKKTKKKSPIVPKIKIKLKNSAPPRIIRPKAKALKQAKIPDYKEMYNIKECKIVLLRQDLTIRLTKPKESAEVPSEEPQIPNSSIVTEQAVIEEPVQEFHFDHVDMLDVSEDIVIDSNCDFKIDDKSSESVPVPVVDDVVLDNSQSSEDDAREAGASKQEETCKVYDFSADEDLRHDAICVTGNADSVLAIECIDNDFVAACLDGNVYHFSGEGALLNTLRGSNLAVTCLTIVTERCGTTIYTGSLDSRIRYYDLETGLEKGPECNVLSPIQTMDRAWDTVFVGTRTGFVLQFECKNNMLIPVSTVKFSEQSILALRALKEGPRKVLLVASRSENVTIKDAQTGLLLRTLDGPQKMTVYTLLYDEGKVYCGTSGNQIQVFDYASGAHIHEHSGGKGVVCLRASGGLLLAGCYDGCVYVYRRGAARPRAQLRGGPRGVMLLSLAVRGAKIIAGYKDRSLYIWKIPEAILQEMVL